MIPGGKTLRLLVRSPEEIIFKKSGLQSVKVTLPDGLVGIHPGHAPLIAEVAAGRVKYTDGQAGEESEIQEGVMVVRNDMIQIFTHTQLDDPNRQRHLPKAFEDEDEIDRLVDEIMKTLTIVSSENEPENASTGT